LAVSVVNERLQRLTLTADRSNRTLQILALDGARAVARDLSAIIRFGPDGAVACQGEVSAWRARNDFPLHGGKETGPYRITYQMPARALPGSHRYKELTPKTTESHWSGGQREP
jgi:hypothetical protein